MAVATEARQCLRCKGPIEPGELYRTFNRPVPGSPYHVTCPGTTPAPAPVVTLAPVSDALLTGVVELDDYREPEPGSRLWLKSATLDQREAYLVTRLAELAETRDVVTRRDFDKLTARLCAGLDRKAARKLERYARGVWDGQTLHPYTPDDFDSRQLELAMPASDATADHGELTLSWRGVVAAWNGGVA